MATPTSPTVNRTTTGSTDDDTQLGEDTSEVTKLFNERLQAWKHACGYLEEYIKSTEKMQHAHGKEYEKVLKTINSPLREGDMFDHNPGGIAGMFDSMRQNTQAISNSHSQTAQTLKSSILPVFERLHSEIKNKQKELAKGAGKGNKQVDKARADAEKHIGRLGTSSSTHHNLTAKDADSDPYILKRGTNHRMNKLFHEENSARQELLSVQNSFSQFESHIVQTFQQGLGQFNSVVGSQADQQKQLYAITTQQAQALDPNHEWNLFVRKNNGILIDPNAAPRSIENSSYANQNHDSTKPMCQGQLERKSGLLKKMDSSFYVVTPSKFLHEFKSDDDLNKDPSPDLSLFLPDCSIGALNGNLFSVRGKDVSKGKLGSAISTSKDYEFRAATSKDAETWYSIIRDIAGTKPGQAISPTTASSASSPTGTLAMREKEAQSLDATNPTSAQETGVTQQSGLVQGAGQDQYGAGQDQYGAGISQPSGVAAHDMAAPTSATPAEAKRGL